MLQVTMAPIDPHHSRPLDVHRWSDHPEVNRVVAEVWAQSANGTPLRKLDVSFATAVSTAHSFRAKATTAPSILRVPERVAPRNHFAPAAANLARYLTGRMATGTSSLIRLSF